MTQQWDILFSGADTMDDDFYEELETILVTADVGVQAAAMSIAETVRKEAKQKQIKLTVADGRRLVYETLQKMMEQPLPRRLLGSSGGTADRRGQRLGEDHHHR